jgi:hypothetical protein
VVSGADIVLVMHADRHENQVSCGKCGLSKSGLIQFMYCKLKVFNVFSFLFNLPHKINFN